MLLYPVYLRGEAYLAAGSPDKAAAEFQKMIDNPGLIANYPLGGMAHLGLARAYAAEAGIPVVSVVANSGPNSSSSLATSPPDFLAKSRAAYRGSIAIWKDGNPEIPLLMHARLEYSKLH